MELCRERYGGRTSKGSTWKRHKSLLRAISTNGPEIHDKESFVGGNAVAVQVGPKSLSFKRVQVAVLLVPANLFELVDRRAL